MSCKSNRPLNWVLPAFGINSVASLRWHLCAWLMTGSTQNLDAKKARRKSICQRYYARNADKLREDARVRMKAYALCWLAWHDIDNSSYSYRARKKAEHSLSLLRRHEDTTSDAKPASSIPCPSCSEKRSVPITYTQHGPLRSLYPIVLGFQPRRFKRPL